MLILGGGDGALLCELLKHQPAKVRVVSQDALEVMLETESLSCRFLDFAGVTDMTMMTLLKV